MTNHRLSNGASSPHLKEFMACAPTFGLVHFWSAALSSSREKAIFFILGGSPCTISHSSYKKELRRWSKVLFSNLIHQLGLFLQSARSPLLPRLWPPKKGENCAQKREAWPRGHVDRTSTTCTVVAFSNQDEEENENCYYFGTTVFGFFVPPHHHDAKL